MADTLPLGYRFCPSDEEVFSYCLAPKVQGHVVFPEFIREFDVYEKEPWKFFNENAEKSLYVFTKLKMKKSRVERTAGSGYWKGAKSTDFKVCHGIIGQKKHLNFKVKDGSSFDSQNAEKGSWIMHEYSMPNQEIVMCKIRFKKEGGGKQGTTLCLSVPIRIPENHWLKDSSDFNNKIDVPHQDINMEPSKTMSLFSGPHVEWNPLDRTGSKEDILALESHPRLAISASDIEDFINVGRPIEQSFMDDATSNGIVNLPTSTIMEEDTDGDDSQWIHKYINFD
ncbi:NAC domain-containing protein JA2L [Eucalyptus grandis]|uniref:NAC domain-containing protein JA2L n=1 Tax=Eucalyptus grandis TaxID=71139 RepID=UPI00192E9FB1|nr:NAC domain-containing protein JA2L [Eucalyptus grandis]